MAIMLTTYITGIVIIWFYDFFTSCFLAPFFVLGKGILLIWIQYDISEIFKTILTIPALTRFSHHNVCISVKLPLEFRCWKNATGYLRALDQNYNLMKEGIVFRSDKFGFSWKFVLQMWFWKQKLYPFPVKEVLAIKSKSKEIMTRAVRSKLNHKKLKLGGQKATAIGPTPFLPHSFKKTSPTPRKGLGVRRGL